MSFLKTSKRVESRLVSEFGRIKQKSPLLSVTAKLFSSLVATDEKSLARAALLVNGLSSSLTNVLPPFPSTKPF